MTLSTNKKQLYVSCHPLGIRKQFYLQILTNDLQKTWTRTELHVNQDDDASEIESRWMVK
jgi:hypothetical protein